MSDLPRHLRAIAECIWNDQGDALAKGDGQACRDAADEIERLREVLARIAWHELPWREARDAARAVLADTRARAEQR